MAPFSDPHAVARYADGPPRFVPGYSAMQSMTTLLLAERVPEDARVLVLGAGGGLELKVFAQARSGWTFDGIDPSAEMLKLAEQTLGPLASRARLHQGYIDGAPQGPFDAATCLLTLHFMALEERRRTAIEIHRRLKPGAPYVIAHLSFPQGEGERALWLSRHAADQRQPLKNSRATDLSAASCWAAFGSQEASPVMAGLLEVRPHRSLIQTVPSWRRIHPD